MIKIKKFVFNPIQTNTYLISDESAECVIIDAACYSKEEVEVLIAYINVQKLKPVKLINTHGHIDHILGLVNLSKKYNLNAMIHKDDLALVEHAAQYAAMFGLECDQWPVIEKFFNDGDIISFGMSELQVIHTPGHSPGSVCFYQQSNNILFSGDTLFSGSIGRTDLPGGNYNLIIASIKNKLLILPDQVRVLSGHGVDTTLKIEKQSNPYLLG